MRGINLGVSTRYGSEIAVMKEMGWGPRDLWDAPDDLIEEILVRMDARNRWEKFKAEWDQR